MTPDLSPVPFANLPSADLTVGRVYLAGAQPNLAAEPLTKLVGVGTSGGFRKRNGPVKGVTVLCVLFSTGEIAEWPDKWDDATGEYVYFGDQRKPGKDVHDTRPQGNRLLSEVSTLVRGGSDERAQVPLFLLFEREGAGRDVRFEGLVVPAPRADWLTAEERSTDDGVISNYRARLSRLAVSVISRSWISDVLAGDAMSANAPDAWRRWVADGAVD